MSKKLFLVAGEPSGDLHASKLAREIKKIDPGIDLKGIGGANMAAEGVSLLYRTDELGIIGLPDIFKHLAKIKRLFYAVLAKVEEDKTDVVVLVDYPGFNLRLAGELKKRGKKVIYYVSPQVWAWGKWRIEKIRRCVEKILVFFKFEEEIYKKACVPVEFVGHPLLDSARPSADKETIRQKFGLDKTKKTIAILPGSREREIAAILPIMTQAARKLYQKSKDLQFIIVRSQNLPEKIFTEHTKNLDAPNYLLANTGSELYDYLSVSDLAIVTSGTATLECTIMEVPMIIAYKVSFFTAIVLGSFMRVRTIGLANILAGRRIVPELVQFDLTANNIYKEASRILFEPGVADDIKKELALVRQKLGSEGASRRAALVVTKQFS